MIGSSAEGNRLINSGTRAMKTLVQCDFDGTITEEDVSFVLLDTFAQGWRRLAQQYQENKLSVGELNTRAFAMVKADRHVLLEALKGKVKVRPGFHDLVNYCSERGFGFVIVSNGLDFYIKSVLETVGLASIEMYSGQASFEPMGIRVRYVGPDGKVLQDGFKEAYIKSFLKLGYRVVYIGNGKSDAAPAKYAQRVFATGDLLAHSRENNLECKPFDTFVEVVKDLSLT